MLVNGQWTAILIEFMYGTAFSFCMLVTLKQLFFRQVKKSALLPVFSGTVTAAATLETLLMHGNAIRVDLLFAVMCLFNALAVVSLSAEKKRSILLPLVLAEVFSASLIRSMQTAVFSVSKGAERSFLQVTLLYIAGYLLPAGFVLLLGKLVRSDDREPLGKLHMILLTVLTMLSGNMIGNSYLMSDYIPDVSPEAAIPSVLMLMSVTVLLLLSVKQQQAKRFRELNELSEKYMSTQAKHFELSRNADTELRMLRHDMRNHISVMYGLFESGKTDELGMYLKELNRSFSDVQAVNITGCEIADAIISEKMLLANQSGVKILTEGSLQGLKINAVMLCTVLSNLLDNAIEAASMSNTDRIITLSARRSGSFYYISISNPSAHNVDVSTDIASSKPDAKHHGLGLKSVRNAVGKCGGTLELSCTETPAGHCFTAEVILPSE